MRICDTLYSAFQIAACKVLAGVLADHLRKRCQLLFVVLSGVCSPGRRNIQRGDLSAVVLQNGDQLAPAVGGNRRHDQGVFCQVKCGIEQPPERGTAERVGVSRRELVRPMRRAEAAAQHIKRIITDRVQNLCRDIVAEHDHLRLSAVQIILVEALQRGFQKPPELRQMLVIFIYPVECFQRLVQKGVMLRRFHNIPPSRFPLLRVLSYILG